MTEKIKCAIDLIENSEDYRYSHYGFIDASGEAFDLAIRSLKAWEEVLQELENKRNLIGRLSKSDAYDMAIYDMAIGIINQHLAEVEKGGAE